MQKSIMLKLSVALLFPLLAFAIGYLLHDPLKSQINQHRGVWEGKSIISADAGDVISHATLVVNNHIRLSIDNQMGVSNYTFDAYLTLSDIDDEYARLELTDRQVTGLDAFQKETGIRMPTTANLVELYMWQLEENRVFLDVRLNNGKHASYVLTKSR
ncbi:hypothetical protein KP803_06550 [Vibrio sp. ZSDE26]|uniref:Uncharacterized protein n=1 Tax=Vibrio amylolyticus TaxID=2847292 RepID=A0A9X1XH58_9VIBR|nr:hypothetical protein [Vibrio amylolyticus]MCK6262937.1 hypothetical protein [Vibrio amylolyticus]